MDEAAPRLGTHPVPVQPGVSSAMVSISQVAQALLGGGLVPVHGEAGPPADLGLSDLAPSDRAGDAASASEGEPDPNDLPWTPSEESELVKLLAADPSLLLPRRQRPPLPEGAPDPWAHLGAALRRPATSVRLRVQALRRSDEALRRAAAASSSVPGPAAAATAAASAATGTLFAAYTPEPASAGAPGPSVQEHVAQGVPGPSALASHGSMQAAVAGALPPGSVGVSSLAGGLPPPGSELFSGLYDPAAMAALGGLGFAAHALGGPEVSGQGGGPGGLSAESVVSYLSHGLAAGQLAAFAGYDASGAGGGPGAEGLPSSQPLLGLPFDTALLQQLQFGPSAAALSGLGAALGPGPGLTAGHYSALGAQLHAASGVHGAGAHAGAGSAAPQHDRRFWNELDQQELLRLAADGGYRAQVLGVSELNWDAIAKHLGRGKRSVQRKFDNLKGSSLVGLALQGGAGGGGALGLGGGPGGMGGGLGGPGGAHAGPGSAVALPLPANDGKKWSAEEVVELLRLVEDPAYLKERLDLDKVDWRQLGAHFGRSYESVSYKFSYVKNTGRTEAKTKHAKAKHETSYKEMAVWALQQLPNADGTSGQICAAIVTNLAFSPQLDTAIVSGKKTLQRWKHGVRSALNAFAMFRKTGAMRDGEVVWRLDHDALSQEQAMHAERAARQRNKPLSGAQRRKLKKAAAAAQAAAQLAHGHTAAHHAGLVPSAAHHAAGLHAHAGLVGLGAAAGGVAHLHPGPGQGVDAAAVAAHGMAAHHAAALSAAAQVPAPGGGPEAQEEGAREALAHMAAQSRGGGLGGAVPGAAGVKRSAADAGLDQGGPGARLGRPEEGGAGAPGAGEGGMGALSADQLAVLGAQLAQGLMLPPEQLAAAAAASGVDAQYAEMVAALAAQGGYGAGYGAYDPGAYDAPGAFWPHGLAPGYGAGDVEHLHALQLVQLQQLEAQAAAAQAGGQHGDQGAGGGDPGAAAALYLHQQAAAAASAALAGVGAHAEGGAQAHALAAEVHRE